MIGIFSPKSAFASKITIAVLKKVVMNMKSEIFVYTYEWVS